MIQHPAVDAHFLQLAAHARATIPDVRDYPGDLAAAYGRMWRAWSMPLFIGDGRQSWLDRIARSILRSQPILHILNGLLALSDDVTAPIRALPDGKLWRAADDGERARDATALPVWEHLTNGGGSLSCVDILAIDGARWRAMAGYATILGRWRHETGPVTVYATPAEWLHAGGTKSGAVCILDPKSADARHLLVNGPPLRASAKHAATLREWQAKLRPSVPEVLVA